MSLVIGVDYGISKNDIPMYSVLKVIGVDYDGARNDIPMYSFLKYEGVRITIIETGEIDSFNYGKYVGKKHKVVGSTEDLKKFKQQFIK